MTLYSTLATRKRQLASVSTHYSVWQSQGISAAPISWVTAGGPADENKSRPVSGAHSWRMQILKSAVLLGCLPQARGMPTSKAGGSKGGLSLEQFHVER